MKKSPLLRKLHKKGLGLGIGLGLGQKTYKNIFYCEKESFTAQTPQKNSMKKIDFKEKSAL